MFRTMLAVSALAMAHSMAAAAQQGETGPDMSLEAISPESEAVNVGLAGQDPSNIARYLLASGAGATGI